jgi:hypothetical protein
MVLNSFTSGSCGGASCASTGNILPVTLQNLSAVAQSNGVLVKWTAGRESNLLQYDICFSSDGSNFNTIGSVAANNNGNYSWLHTGSLSNNIAYYRIKTTDINGSIAYSPITSTHVKSHRHLSVAINPVSDFLSLTGLVNKGAVSIVGLTGKKMMEQKVLSADLLVNVASLTPGLYLVQYYNGSQTEIQKFVKK